MDNQELKDLIGFKIDKKVLLFFTRLMMKFFPNLVIKKFMQNNQNKNMAFGKLYDVFAESERVDLFPLTSSNGRGFMMVLDKNATLYFNQNYDHF